MCCQSDHNLLKSIPNKNIYDKLAVMGKSLSNVDKVSKFQEFEIQRLKYFCAIKISTPKF